VKEMSTKAVSKYFSLFEAKLRQGITFLDDKPEETIESTLRALWHLAAGNPVSVEKAKILDLPELNEVDVEKLNHYVNRRLNGVPLAHITNRQQFMGIEFIVGPEALVPRKETELLGYGALELLNKCVERKDAANVIDVCTGLGNLAIALAYHQSRAKIYASDLSADAVELAKRNSSVMKLDGKVSFYTGDLLQPFNNSTYYKNIDLLICNPPYISSGKLKSIANEIIGYEPDIAFDGGPFGVNILIRLIKEAPKYLNQNGWLAFELGLGQGEHIFRRLEKNDNYKELIAIKNDNGDIRAIMAQVNHN
jgi:release factor glutamine methyltransferase